MMRIVSFLLVMIMCFSINISAFATSIEERNVETKEVSERATSIYNYNGVPGSSSGIYYLGFFYVKEGATVNISSGGIGNDSKYDVINATTGATVLSEQAVGSGSHTFVTTGYCQIRLYYKTVSGTITINVY